PCIQLQPRLPEVPTPRLAPPENIRLAPGRTVVRGDLDALDRASAASYRITGDRHRAFGYRCAVERPADDRVDGHGFDSRDRAPIGRLRANLRREYLVRRRLIEVFRLLGLESDARQPLHAASADVTRHDAAKWEPVEAVERKTVHLVRQKRVVLERFVDRDRRAEAD